ncbi:MAG: GxxExxY protein [Chloroflexi bacterium]|nr:GxxExxY protein [Chloroflexota bacterium]
MLRHRRENHPFAPLRAGLELKATKGLTEIDEAQLINYLKGTGYPVGLLLNFGTPSLEHERRVV